MGRPTKNSSGVKADAFITIRVSSDIKEEIKEEAQTREITVTELLLTGYDTLKEGKYIDFK